jgi:hypothetical protein
MNTLERDALLVIAELGEASGHDLVRELDVPAEEVAVVVMRLLDSGQIVWTGDCLGLVRLAEPARVLHPPEPEFVGRFDSDLPLDADPRFDPVRTWQRYEATDQQLIGAAAIVLAIAEEAAHELEDPRLLSHWAHAGEEAQRILRLAAASKPGASAGYYPEGPNLAPLGIRQCRVCGCTDFSGCEGGCHWVDATLCSVCLRARKPAR